MLCTRKNEIRSLAFGLAAAVAAAGCGDCSAKKRPAAPAKAVAQAQEDAAVRPSSSGPDAADPDAAAPGSAPLAAPAAYFGDLGLERIAEPVEAGARDKDSIVLLVADTLNIRHVGAYGYERPTSPNIDAMASQGVLFANHVSNSSWTRPSMTTILTGLPKRDHGVELRGPPVEPRIETLAERFREAGYRTAGLSGNPLIRKDWGYDQGFQYWHDIKTLEVKGFPPDRVLGRPAMEWLEQIGDDRPFFLMIFFTAPHPPYRPLEGWRKFLATVPPGEVNEHPFKEYQEPLPEGEHARIVAAYDDEIRYMDDVIGNLIDSIDESGKADHTSVIFTADHGEMFGQHNCYLHAYHMYEQTLRVPMIVRSPRIPARGVHSDLPFTHIDVAPTALDLAGLGVPEDLPGKSMLAALAEPEGHRERIRFSQYDAHGVRREAIRKGRYKLVHHHEVEPDAARRLNELHPHLTDRPDPESLPSLAWEGERYEYFDMVADPDENRDIYDGEKGSEEMLELLDALAEWADIEIESDLELSEEVLEALEAAGYIVRDDEPEGEAAKEDHDVDVVKDGVRVRIAPVDGRVIDKVGTGERVRFLKRSGKADWCHVITRRDREGYIICSALDLD